MVAALNDIELGWRGEPREERPQLLGRAERIARSLHEQHGRADRGQMFGAKLLRLAGRMQRIPEQPHPRDVMGRGRGGGNLRRDTPAHRLAADEELVGGYALTELSLMPRRNHLAPARFQLVVLV